MSWNMPPGVSESMIPGNRPEDIAEDALYARIFDILPEEIGEVQVEAIVSMIYEAYNNGYRDALTDAMLADMQKESNDGE